MTNPSTSRPDETSPYLDKLPVYRYTVLDKRGKPVSRHRSLAAARYSIENLPAFTIRDEWGDAQVT